MNKKLRWERIKNALESRMNPGNFSQWISNLALLETLGSENEIILNCPNSFVEDWVRQHYLEDIIIVAQLNHPDLQIALVTQNSADAPAASPATKQQKSKAKPPAVSDERRGDLQNKFRFDTYVTGPNNEFAYTICKNVADAPGTEFNPCLLSGGTGLGKTHLIHAIGNAYLDENPDGIVKYMTATDLVNRIIYSFQKKDTAAVTRNLNKTDLLLIDDIQLISGKSGVSNIFFEVFNNLVNNNKQIVLTSDRPPREVEKLDDRIKSRFAAGIELKIQPPLLETRFNILKKKIELHVEKNSNAPVGKMKDEDIFFIAENIVDNVRELEGVLLLLNAKAQMQSVTIDRAYIERQISDQLTGTRAVTGDQILEFVSKNLNVALSEIKSKSRMKTYAEARQIVMYLCKSCTDMSYPDIGKMLSRDHATVMHGVKKVEERIKNDPVFRVQIETYKRNLNR